MKSIQNYIEAIKRVTEAENLKRQLEEIQAVLLAIKENSTLVETLVNPLSKKEDLKNIINSICVKQKVTPITQNFLNLLIKNRRFQNIDQFVTAINKAIQEAENSVIATIQTPFKLKEGNQKEILDFLKTLTTATIQPDFVVDETLIGGFRARLEGLEVDGTLDTALNKLKKAVTH